LQEAGRLSFHRVTCDVEAVIADVCAIGLDATFTERRVQFLRTGHDREWSRPCRKQ
jgi:hypothetical protein